MNHFKLIKVLYGRNQSPSAWNVHLNGHLKRFDFKKVNSDTCVYLIRYKGNQLCIVAIYVDDLIIAGSTITVVNDVKSLF